MGSHTGRDEAQKSSREKRLAEALRANLKRRKAQLRKRSAASDEEAGSAGNENAKESG